MRYRKLGKTGCLISEVGFGAWGVGGGWWKGTDEKKALESMNLAIDYGVNFIDTALGYENSENLVNQVLKSRSERIYVSSKVPPKNYVFPAVPGSDVKDAYPKEWIIECTEKSLKQLGLECLDLQLLHVWVNSWAASDEWREAARMLEKQGKIRAFGASINFPYSAEDDGILCMESGFDVCEVVYNIFQQEPNADLLPAAKKNDVGIIARCPLDEGSLTGKITPETVFPEGSFLEGYFKEDRKKVAQEKTQALKWLVDEEHAGSLAEAALRYCLSNEAVSTVIVGMRNPKWVGVNTSASDRGPLPTKVVSRLKEHAFNHNWWV